MRSGPACRDRVGVPERGLDPRRHQHSVAAEGLAGGVVAVADRGAQQRPQPDVVDAGWPSRAPGARARPRRSSAAARRQAVAQEVRHGADHRAERGDLGRGVRSGDGGGKPARHGRLVAGEPGIDRREQLGHRLQPGEPQPSGAFGGGAQERQGGDRPVDEQHGVGPHQVGLHDEDEHARLQRQLPRGGERRRDRVAAGVLVAAEPEQRLHPPGQRARARRRPARRGGAPRPTRRVGRERAAAQYGQRLAEQRGVAGGRVGGGSGSRSACATSPAP